MIICFNCSAETKDHLDQLLLKGSYRDYGEAISAAVRNQALMEAEIAVKGAIVFGECAKARFAAPEVLVSAPVPASVMPTAEAITQSKTKIPAIPLRSGKNLRKSTNVPIEKTRNTPAGARKSDEQVTVVPALFQLNGFATQEAPAGLAELPPDMWVSGQLVPLDRWMLGQQNRLLPAKANSRAIVRLFLNELKGLPITETANRIATSAVSLGDYLAALDDIRNAGRDDALATAFPTTGEGADKGCVRYANQFVVYQNGRGELSGLMVDLKLINVVRRRKERLIVPTRVAWELARLPNAVFDEGDMGDRFSKEERSLLLEHISTSVPVEAFAYRAILEAVREGSDTPDTLDSTLKKAYVTEDRAEKLSQSFLASQRSGAISRMSDLDLIERERSGVRVSYSITEAGKSFLKRDTKTKQD